MIGNACRHPDRNRQAEICRALIRERDVVRESVGHSLCANAHWDMLLALDLAAHERRRMMLTALCAASYMPEATAYRKVADLERHGLIARVDDLEDRRRVEMSLTGNGTALLAQLLVRLDNLFAVRNQ